MDPSLCEFEALHLDVVTAEGDHFGQTAVISGGQPNVNVFLDPDVSAVKQKLIDDLSASR